VMVSPLSRAQQTCRLAGYGEVAEVMADLAEWDYGDYEGRTTVDIWTERPGWQLWVDGVPRGETLAELAVRADRVVATIRAGTGEVAVFSHGHFLRVLASRWVGLGPECGALLALDAGGVCRLAWEHENPVINLWNSTS
ncbi:MAG: histidine phosphatase family protein, partial [Acidimicrobiales bacterium]